MVYYKIKVVLYHLPTKLNGLNKKTIVNILTLQVSTYPDTAFYYVDKTAILI